MTGRVRLSALSVVELVTVLALLSLLAMVGFAATRPVLDRGEQDAARVRLATAMLEARRAVDAGQFPADPTALSVPGLSFTADTASGQDVGALRADPSTMVLVTRSGQGCMALVYQLGSAARWGAWAQSASCSAVEAWSVQDQVQGTELAPSKLV